MHNEFQIGFFRLNVRRGLISISDAIASKIERNSTQLRILTSSQPLSSQSLESGLWSVTRGRITRQHDININKADFFVAIFKMLSFNLIHRHGANNVAKSRIYRWRWLAELFFGGKWFFFKNNGIRFSFFKNVLLLDFRAMPATDILPLPKARPKCALIVPAGPPSFWRRWKPEVVKSTSKRRLEAARITSKGIPGSFNRHQAMPATYILMTLDAEGWRPEAARSTSS
jgi:hypothetical protein